MSYAELLIKAIISAIEAGKAIMNIYYQPYTIDTKDENHPVTTADIHSHRIICQILNDTHLPIVSEETEHLSDSVNQSYDKYWLIDPLDGTKEFINKNDEFTVNIALIEAKKPVIGVVYAPACEILYFASENTGSIKVAVNNHRINVSSLQELPLKVRNNNEKIIAVSRSHLDEKTKAFVEIIKTQYPTQLLSCGSSLKLCYLAEGTVDIYPRFGKTMEWDIAAGHALLLYSNADLLDKKTLNALTYGKQNFENPEFIAIRKDIRW
ncbi:MAG: 3'(2'),5'-bisphosphate nucleotidase CysQ [Bacteroidales bacterium]|nr:3'(2'),5'-bisphosphate nucleotidase CysQ [Bacteroidales bacterium]